MKDLKLNWNLNDLIPIKDFDKKLDELYKKLKEFDKFFKLLSPNMKESDFKALIEFSEQLSEEYSNLAYENLRNTGYRKTNLFSLNYKITDFDGNFINAYSLDEVKTKLLGLKKWLTENIIPLGTKIIDITGKYTLPKNFYIKHETYMNKNYKVEEYGEPVDCDVKGYLQPTSNGSDMFDISVEFKSKGNIERN